MLIFSLLSKENVGFVLFFFFFFHVKGFCTMGFRERRCETFLLFPGTALMNHFAPLLGGAGSAGPGPGCAPPSIPVPAVPPPGDTAAMHGWDSCSSTPQNTAGTSLPSPATRQRQVCTSRIFIFFPTQLSCSHPVRCWTSQGGLRPAVPPVPWHPSPSVPVHSRSRSPSTGAVQAEAGQAGGGRWG